MWVKKGTRTVTTVPLNADFDRIRTHAILGAGTADGDLLRTGMGAMRDPKSWQLYKGGYGPSPEGMFLQSNFGVVTKLGMWLMPRPESFRVCDVKFAHEDDLERMVDVTLALVDVARAG